MEEVLQALAGNQVYSGVDGFSGYFSILMEDSSILLTTFIEAGIGAYPWKVMPFGLQGAPGTYSEVMNMIFADVRGPNLQYYLDNLESWT